jgi:hypothetical protein
LSPLQRWRKQCRWPPAASRRWSSWWWIGKSWNTNITRKPVKTFCVYIVHRRRCGDQKETSQTRLLKLWFSDLYSGGTCFSFWTRHVLLLLLLLLFWLYLFHLCPVHCPLFFVFVCCAVFLIGHLAVDSAH